MWTPLGVCFSTTMNTTVATASRSTGMGMPNSEPRPKMANIGSATVTDFAPVMIWGIAAAIPKVENVTMNGGSRTK